MTQFLKALQTKISLKTLNLFAYLSETLQNLGADNNTIFVKLLETNDLRFMASY